MLEIKSEINQRCFEYKAILSRYLLILIISCVLTASAAPFIWGINIHVAHTVMETICVYISFSTFSIIWNSKHETLGIYNLIGYGFLAVAIFDSYHTYTWLLAAISTELSFDLSTRYWIIGRLVESLSLFALSVGLRIKVRKKWEGLLLVSTFSVGLSMLILYFPSIMPVMLTEHGLTSAKVTIEYGIVSILLISLYNLRNRIREEEEISYGYIFMSLLFMIAAELCFTLYITVTEFVNMYGHVLKIICYYCLYKAVHGSCIEYPYEKLAEAYDKLEEGKIKVKELSDILNDTLDALPIGILYYESNKRIKYMNNRLEEILACDRNELYGIAPEEFLRVFPTEEQDEQNIYDLTNKSKKDSVSRIRTYRNMKGEKVKLALTTQKIKNGLLVYFHEVKKEQEIENFHLQTQTILNAVNNCVILTDKFHRILLYNDAFNRVFEIGGMDLSGLEMSTLYDIIHIDTDNIHELLYKGEGEDLPQRATITSMKGNIKEMLLNGTPIKNIEKETIGAIYVFTDITAIYKQQQDMQQQEKLALIGQMAAGIVHEIKNPLATIKGLSQLIRIKSRVDKVREYSEVIDSAVDDVTKVANEFLSFAKPKPTLKKRTSLNGIVEAMHLLIETQCYTKNIKSKFNYFSYPMEITADESKIKQVVLNITENAIAAMEDRTDPELVISTYYDAEAKEGVISIKDNGKGMSPEVLAMLGTPFYTTKEKGTGLGLGISYQIIKEHNGRIDVQSEEDVGTVFKIIFSQIEDML